MTLALQSSLTVLIPMLPLLSMELLGQSFEKTDVIGFSILLLELITRMRALEFGKTFSQKGTVFEWVKKIQQEKKVEVLVDRELGCNYKRIYVG